MSMTDGHLAIMRRIADTPGAPNVVWPDQPGDTGALPRWVMQASGGRRRTWTIGGTTEADPEVTVRVETAEGNFGNESRDLVNLLLSRFPVHERFAGLRVMVAPDVRPPLPGTPYAVPVIISARFYF